MRTVKPCLSLLAVVVVGTLAGCATRSTKADSIRTSLDQAGLKDVSVSRDPDNGVLTLGGHVPADGDKSQAESIARTVAGAEVVSNRIAVIPPGARGDAKTADAKTAASDVDQGIERSLDAALIENRLHESVHYDVKNSVVTLTGEVESQSKRRRAEAVAVGVPNVLQVVNNLRIRGQKIWRVNRN
jgi:osmotically-inducible protein OsmY